MLFAIDAVANQRKTNRLHVYPNLVRASGLELTQHQRHRSPLKLAGGQPLIMRNGRLGCLQGTHCHLDPLARMTANRRFDASARYRLPPHQRKIFTADAALLQLPDQIGLRQQGLGDHHQATGIFIQPVHNTGTRDACQLRPAMQQAIQ